MSENWLDMDAMCGYPNGLRGYDRCAQYRNALQADDACAELGYAVCEVWSGARHEHE